MVVCDGCVTSNLGFDHPRHARTHPHASSNPRTLHIESRSAPRWHAVQGLTASTANTASDRHQPPARSTHHTRNANQHNTQWVASDWGDSRSLLIVAGRDDALPHVEVCDVSIIMFTHSRSSTTGRTVRARNGPRHLFSIHVRWYVIRPS